MGHNRTWRFAFFLSRPRMEKSTTGSIPYILVSGGSESIFIEITEYNFISLLSARAGL